MREREPLWQRAYRELELLSQLGDALGVLGQLRGGLLALVRALLGLILLEALRLAREPLGLACGVGLGTRGLRREPLDVDGASHGGEDGEGGAALGLRDLSS